MRPIKISLDPKEKIADLYGIGSVIAERIVWYRENKGYFHNPEELARVEGINNDLAILLSPQIDFEIPVATKNLREQKWHLFAIGILGIIFAFWQLISRAIPDLNESFSMFLSGHNRGWISIWISISILLVVISFLLALLFTTISFVAKEDRTERYLNRLSLYSAIGGIVFIIFTGIGNIFYYQLAGWGKLLSNQVAIAAVIFCIPITIFFGLMFLLIWKPNLAYSVLAARIFDGILIFTGIIIGILTPVIFKISMANYLKIFVSIFNIAISLFILYYVTKSLKTGETFLVTALDLFIDAAELVKSSKDLMFWQNWINTRLPNPEEQKALKKALEETYQSSKTQKIFSFIVLSVGGWLLITTLDAIVQWLIQGWLNDYFLGK